jgi:hypothetical protein
MRLPTDQRRSLFFSPKRHAVFRQIYTLPFIPDGQQRDKAKGYANIGGKILDSTIKQNKNDVFRSIQ